MIQAGTGRKYCEAKPCFLQVFASQFCYLRFMRIVIVILPRPVIFSAA